MKPVWKHVFSNTIFMFLHIAYTQSEKKKETLFEGYLLGTKSQNSWYLYKE